MSSSELYEILTKVGLEGDYKNATIALLDNFVRINIPNSFDKVIDMRFDFQRILKPSRENIYDLYRAQKSEYNSFNEVPEFVQYLILSSKDFGDAGYDGKIGNLLTAKSNRAIAVFNNPNLEAENIGESPTLSDERIALFKQAVIDCIYIFYHGLEKKYQLKTSEEKEKINDTAEVLYLQYDNNLFKIQGESQFQDSVFNKKEEFLAKKRAISINLLRFGGKASKYITEKFGGDLGGLFSIQSFREEVSKEIKSLLETEGVLNVDDIAVPNVQSSGDIEYWDYGEETFWGNRVKQKMTKEQYNAASENKAIVDSLYARAFPNASSPVNDDNILYGTVRVKYEIVKKYFGDNPLKANEIETYPSELIDVDHKEQSLATNNFPKGIKVLKIGDVFDPEITKIDGGFLWFDSTENSNKVSDLILAHYLRFTQHVEQDIMDGPLAGGTNNLDYELGKYFNWEAKDLAGFLVPKLAKVAKEFDIEAAFKKIAETSVEDLKKLTADEVKEAIDEIEKEVQNNINDLPQDETQEFDLSPEDIEKRQKLYKQCALLLNAHTLKDEYSGELRKKKKAKNSVHSKNFFNGRFWMVEDKPNHNTTLNKLVTPTGKAAKPFMEITPDILAALHPRLRLHKIYKTKNNKIQTHEIPFESFYPKSRSDGLSSAATFDRGAGYGIKEFSFSFDGETPATAQKFIKAKLSLYFQTFNDFIKERTLELHGETYTFRYLDLFVNTKFCPRSGLNSFSPLHYDPSFYRLRVDVGWEPRNDEQFAQILNKRFDKNVSVADFNISLNRINKTFYLNLLDHSININEDGTVTIDADYIAYMQGVLQSNSFNALTTKYARQKQKKYAEDYEELLSNSKCTPEQLDELAATINSISDKISQSLHQGVIKRLIKNNAMYNVTIEETAVNDFRNTDFFSKIPKLKKSGITVAPDKKNAVANAKNTEELQKVIQSNFVQDTEYRENRKIYFFFMADLIYIILDSLYGEDGITQEESAENLKIILSSFSFKNPYVKAGDVHLNIGQIPIDIDTFLSWYEREIIKKEITTMPILTFIKRLLHYLIQDVFLETCINRQEHKRLVFQSTSFLAVDEQAGETGANGEQTSDSSNDPMNTLYTKDPVADLAKSYGKRLPLETGIRSTGPKPSSQFYNYLFIYPHYRSGGHQGTGDPFEDQDRGVHHLYIGADRGLTKKISFSKSDIQYIRESRMMQQGSNGLLQLSSVYRASVSMVGNTLFYPGMEIYINPFGFGGLEFGLPNKGPGTVEAPNLSNIMGIGGYYQILKVNSKISPGSFTTDIDAHFVYSGDKRPVNRDGLKKVDLCKDIKSIAKGEDDDEACRTVILDAQNVVLDSDGATTTTPSGEAVDAQESSNE